jgi:PAS domain S-box-containing protein
VTGELAGRLRLETQSELQAVLVRLSALRGHLEDTDADAETRLRELEDAVADIRETQAALLERASEFEEALDVEHRRYHDLFDRAPDAYVVTDRSGKILDSNLAASALLGRAEQFLRGKPLPVFAAHSERRLLRSKLLALPRDALDEFELVLETPAGTRQVAVRAASEDVRQPRIRWLLRDVTDRKRAEAEVQSLNEQLERRIVDRTRELTETSARLLTVLQQLPDGVLIFDGDGELQLANQRAEELLGQPAERLGFAVEEMRSSPHWPLARVLETGEPAKHDRVELERDGTTLLLELDVVPVRSGSATVAVVMAFEDVTDRERRERAERDFVTNAAHELQTPIASIASAIDVLQAGAKDRPEDRDRFLDHIERANTRLGNLTRALLTLARAQNRSEQPRAEVIPLAPLLRSVAELTAGSMIEVTCADDVAVIANRPLLEQALANLSENAVKYAGGEVHLAAGRANGRVSIDVVDRGPGIADAHRAHVFERFYRGEGQEAGFGLGLAIVREAVDALGGELALDSGPHGTRVSIALPGARIRPT